MNPLRLLSRHDDQSPTTTLIALLVALVAFAGTRFLGWEWGDGRPVPTALGVLVAGVAILLVARRLR